jgi:hypothetical protein
MRPAHFWKPGVLQALLVHPKCEKLDAQEREHLLSLQPSEHDDAETAYGKKQGSARKAKH